MLIPRALTLRLGIFRQEPTMIVPSLQPAPVTLDYVIDLLNLTIVLPRAILPLRRPLRFPALRHAPRGPLRPDDHGRPAGRRQRLLRPRTPHLAALLAAPCPGSVNGLSSDIPFRYK